MHTLTMTYSELLGTVKSLESMMYDMNTALEKAAAGELTEYQQLAITAIKVLLPDVKGAHSKLNATLQAYKKGEAVNIITNTTEAKPEATKTKTTDNVIPIPDSNSKTSH